MNMRNQCPVCGAQNNNMSVLDVHCYECGTQNAFVPYFAGKKSYRIWQEKMRSARFEKLASLRVQISQEKRLSVGDKLIAYCVPEKNKICIAFCNEGKIREENNASAISLCDVSYAILYTNGTVRVFGGTNEYGQQNTTSWKNIRHILVTPKCSYGVTDSGTLFGAGIPVNSDVTALTDIKALLAGTTLSGDVFLACLSKDGTVKVIGMNDPGINTAEIEKLREITQIAVARNCLLSLSSNGTVSFIGREDDPRRSVGDWKDVVAVSVDNALAYGLTKDGRVLVAGTVKKILDKGRSDAASWMDVMMISSNASAICAVTASGELKFAGTMAGDVNHIHKLWTSHIMPEIFFS